MEKQFTTEDYNHIKKNGFKPQICPKCQEIDSILNKVAISGSSALDLYEACKAVDEYFSASYPENMKLKRIAVEKLEQALRPYP